MQNASALTGSTAFPIRKTSKGELVEKVIPFPIKAEICANCVKRRSSPDYEENWFLILLWREEISELMLEVVEIENA